MPNARPQSPYGKQEIPCRKIGKKVREGVEFPHSHIPLSNEPINLPPSRQPPTHTTHPFILSPYTHTPSHHTHPHTQPQDSIHMPMHRLLGIRHSGHQSNVFWVYVSRTFPSVFWFVVTGFWFSLLLCILDQPVCGHCHQNALPLKCFYWFRCPICGGKIGSAGNFQCPPRTVQTRT